MTREPFDFSSIDPRADARRFDDLVGAILEGAADELAARRAASEPLVLLARWTRPALAAAAAVAVIALAALARAPEPAVASTDLVEAMGVPQAFAPAVRGEASADAGDLLSAMSEER